MKNLRYYGLIVGLIGVSILGTVIVSCSKKSKSTTPDINTPTPVISETPSPTVTPVPRRTPLPTRTPGGPPLKAMIVRTLSGVQVSILNMRCGDTKHLDGTHSYSDAGITSYLWKIEENRGTLTHENEAIAYFTAPSCSRSDPDQALHFSLTITDGLGRQDTAGLTMFVGPLYGR